MSSEQGVAALERELAVLLRRARAFSDELARSVHPDLEPSAYGLLIFLEESGGARAADVAGYFGIDKSTVSRQVRLLEQLGLLVRTSDPVDARVRLLEATEEGARRLQAARTARRARVLTRIGDWDTGDVADLARLLARFNATTVPESRPQ